MLAAVQSTKMTKEDKYNGVIAPEVAEPMLRALGIRE
jgi:hypothetical protein